MHFSKLQRKVLAAVFCCLIFVPGVIHVGDLARIGRAAILSCCENGLSSFETSSAESAYNDLHTQDDFWVNTYGLFSAILQKREVADFSVVKDFQENLYVPEDLNDRVSVDSVVSDLVALRSAAEGIDAEFLFVQSAYKTYTEVDELSDYADSYLDSDYDETLTRLHSLGIETIDLRGEAACCNWYATDHHWTCEAAFSATCCVVRFLEDEFGFSLTPSQRVQLDSANYNKVVHEDCFLGSAGVKVGSWYVGKDDFSYLSPTWDTSFTYQHFVDGELDGFHEGSFDEAFIDNTLLADEGYNNKYNAFLYGGFVENRIVNNVDSSDSKLLFVAHSYGRPMAQYLSLYFKEVVYLDPQEGRYNDNYVEYIQSYCPDYVVVMYNGEINVEGL